MTVQLDWPPEVVARLKEEARQRGLSLDAYLLQTVLEAQIQSAKPSGDQERQLAREEAGRNIRNLRKGTVLGPELSIRDLIEEGRRF